MVVFVIADARAIGHSLISDRLKQDEQKQGVIQQLTDTARLTTQLEAQLRRYILLIYDPWNSVILRASDTL